jgi:hypothetical protein
LQALEATLIAMTPISRWAMRTSGLLNMVLSVHNIKSLVLAIYGVF